MEIGLYQSQYGMSVGLNNSQFYNMDQAILDIEMPYANNSILIKNCTFKHIKGYVDHMVYGRFSINNVIVLFENCSFSFNEASWLLSIEAVFYDGLCLHPSNFTFKTVILVTTMLLYCGYPMMHLIVK